MTVKNPLIKPCTLDKDPVKVSSEPAASLSPASLSNVITVSTTVLPAVTVVAMLYPARMLCVERWWLTRESQRLTSKLLTSPSTTAVSQTYRYPNDSPGANGSGGTCGPGGSGAGDDGDGGGTNGDGGSKGGGGGGGGLDGDGGGEAGGMGDGGGKDGGSGGRSGEGGSDGGEGGMGGDGGKHVPHDTGHFSYWPRSARREQRWQYGSNFR